MSASRDDVRFMRMALACAARGAGATRPNPPVGAVVVGRDGALLGKGYHRRAGEPHAEVNAIAACGDADLSGATIYVTLEPCSTYGRTPPCCDLLIRRRLRRVVVGCVDPDPRHAGRGLDVLRAAGVEVVTPVCEDACREMIAPFACRTLLGRPRVTLKLASTLDGRIADRTGASRWISGPASRAIVRRMRKTADAILVGAGTAVADDPGLLAMPRGAPGGAYRVVLDARGRLPAGLRLLSDGRAGRTVVATTADGAAALGERLPAGSPVRIWAFEASPGGLVPLLPVLARLAGELCVMDVLCEGGGKLAGSLLEEDLVDRLAVFYAPLVLGDPSARPSFDGPGALLADAVRLGLEKVRRAGDDVFATFSRKKPRPVV